MSQKHCFSLCIHVRSLVSVGVHICQNLKYLNEKAYIWSIRCEKHCFSLSYLTFLTKTSVAWTWLELVLHGDGCFRRDGLQKNREEEKEEEEEEEEERRG